MCISLLQIVWLIIWVIVICGAIEILRLLLAQVFPGPAYMEVLLRILRVVVGVIIAIAIVWLIYDLLTCLPGPRLR